MLSENSICTKSVSFQDILDAEKRIKPYIHRTPVLTCETLNQLAGKQLYFKCENFQKVGAFKARGAFNAILQLSKEEASKGVVTHSSGNHAQALSLAAKIRGIKAYIVMPRNAPTVKVDGVKGYGAEVILCEPTSKSRTETCERIQKNKGAVFVPPFNDQRVIAGQGTVALELLEDVPDLDAIIAPVSGGGLLSGISIAAKGINPNIKIFAAEPKGADDVYQSLKHNRLILPENPQTICDGLRQGMGDLTYSIIKENVSSCFTATDEETREAMFLLWERMKLVVEPSGAIPLAVALSEEVKALKGIKKLGLVLSGGNLDIKNWDWNAKL